MENNQKETFQFTYSAKEQEELRRIRGKYLPREENKIEQLRRLDQGVTNKATALSLAVGILGTLLLGVGMCCTMVWQGQWFIPGIVVGVIGMAVAAMAYPLYTHTLERERERIAPQILRLTDELIK